jgi:2'-5' RNA ligase
MRFDEIYESLSISVSGSAGTYVGRKLDSVSRQLIMILQKELGLGQNSVKEEDLHITMMYSFDQPRFPFVPEMKSIKSEIGTSAKLDWFGEDKKTLVLAFDCPELKARHLEIGTFYGLRHTYNPYKPHVTLAYDVPNPEKINLTKGVLPAYLRFIGEYHQELDLDWKKRKGA